MANDYIAFIQSHWYWLVIAGAAVVIFFLFKKIIDSKKEKYSIWDDQYKDQVDVIKENKTEMKYFCKEGYYSGLKKTGIITGLMAVDINFKPVQIPAKFKDDLRYIDLKNAKDAALGLNTDGKSNPFKNVHQLRYTTKEEFFGWRDKEIGIWHGKEKVYWINFNALRISFSEQALILKPEIWLDKMGKIIIDTTEPLLNQSAVVENVNKLILEHSLNAMGKQITDFTYVLPSSAIGYENKQLDAEIEERKRKTGRAVPARTG